MNKKVYLIQPTYRSMDGKLIKEMPIFNYSYNVPMLSATIPPDWEKEFCLEYFEDVDYSSNASVIIITSMGYDILRAKEIAEKFRAKGKYILFGGHMDEFSDSILGGAAHSVFHGYPDHKQMNKILQELITGKYSNIYDCEMNIDFTFDYSMFEGKRMLFIPIVSSLGCKNTCSFCCYTPPYKGNYRLRNIKNVLRDLKKIQKINKTAAFLDANIYNNREYLKRLCNGMIKEKIKLRWGAQCTIDVSDDPEILNLMYKSGCRLLFIGLESINQQNLDYLGKPFNTSKYLNQLHRIKKSGIFYCGSFMVGLEEDNVNSFESLYKFILQSKITLPHLNIFLPLPGTVIYNQLKSEGRLSDILADNEKFQKNNPVYSVPCNNSYFQPKRLTKDTLENEFLKIYGKLFTIIQIIRRSLVFSPVYSIIFFRLNLELRKKYKAMMIAHNK